MSTYLRGSSARGDGVQNELGYRCKRDAQQEVQAIHTEIKVINCVTVACSTCTGVCEAFYELFLIDKRHEQC